MGQIEFRPADQGSFLWLDFEFTGLSDSEDVVIEAGAIATDGMFTVKDEFSAFIRYPDKTVESLMLANPWWVERPEHMAHMLNESSNATNDLASVATELASFAEETRSGGSLYLAGNSIHNDRKWVRRDFPELENKLHYRMLDVTSFKLFVASTIGIEYVKEEHHRVIDDIKESIEELKYLSSLLTQL
jgi:oligoribonuclease